MTGRALATFACEPMDAPEMPVAMRPFGCSADLDLEFASGDRPALVTALLAQCMGADAQHWWARTVGERVAALLHLYGLNERLDRVELGARCLGVDCGESFAFELPLTELAALAPTDDSWSLALPDGRTLRLRRPTGSDLKRWRAQGPATRGAALQAILQDLAPGQPLAAEDETALAEGLAESDPLVDLRVAARCPACGHGQEVAVDLEGLVLTRFAARQRELLLEVHRLARHYGWTEDQVLAVPPRRRAEYLALIEGVAS